MRDETLEVPIDCTLDTASEGINHESYEEVSSSKIKMILSKSVSMSGNRKSL